MTTIVTDEEKKKKRNRILILGGVILLIIVAFLIFWFRSQIRATTMRILRIEGEVTLEDNGKPKTITNNLRLNSGNSLSTAIQSLVSIGLDDTKIVTLDQKSRAEFNQSGRKLDLKLTDGSLFFEVQKPLEDEETFDIRTSTMVVGIRGTSGWVSVDGEHESLIVTDGVVHVIGTNPVTGEVKEIDVRAGQRIKVYLYNDRKVDSIMFYLEDITERDLPEFVLERLRENPLLLDKVIADTKWDKPWILGLEVSKLTPTPTPIPEATSGVKKSDDNDAVIEVEEEPERIIKQDVTEPTKEELEELLKQMMAMVTPTPTWTPTPTESSEDPYKEEESTPTPTPTPTASPTPIFGQYGYISGTGEITDSNGDVIGTWNGGNPRFSKAGTYKVPLDVPSAGTVNDVNDIDLNNSVGGITIDASTSTQNITPMNMKGYLSNAQGKSSTLITQNVTMAKDQNGVFTGTAHNIQGVYDILMDGVYATGTYSFQNGTLDTTGAYLTPLAFHGTYSYGTANYDIYDVDPINGNGNIPFDDNVTQRYLYPDGSVSTTP